MLHRIFSIASLSYFKAPTAFATGSNLSSLRRFPAPLVRSHLLPRTRTYSMQMDLDIPAIKDGQTMWGNFELVKSFKAPSTNIPVQKWRSTKTGLSFVWAGVEGPLVSGTFTIPTEIFDDTGRPHTLEHLVFLGSDRYPYKGILDNLANRSFADGTNAWTDTDHTAYTIECAGGEGFLKILPVYIDHILYPTITSEGFVTEVHHVNGLGENAGVVYAEMQARENGSGDLMALKMQRLMYPKTSAYRSETGGLMPALRELTVEQIREYHASLYVPHNLTLLITGSSCPLPDLLHTLQTVVEPRILAKTPMIPADWKRPFIETSSNTEAKWEQRETKKVVKFMEADESVGEVQISFGESVKRDDWVEVLAVDVLTTYLTDSAVAPLNKEFVEIPEPYCTSLDIYTAVRVKTNELTVYISDVPAEHLESIDGMVKAALKRIVDEGVDMDRMRMVLQREKRQNLHNLETSPGGVVSQAVISDLLYGSSTGADLENSFQFDSQYAALEKWSGKDWTDRLRKFFVSAPSITVVGKPSAALAKEIEKTEKARIAAQRKSLGEAGLEEKKRVLKEAQAFNEREIPKEILEEFLVPEVKSVSWIDVETAVNDPAGSSRSGSVQKHIDADPAKLPFFAHFSSVKSNFLTVDVFCSTLGLPAHLRPYGAVWTESFFSLPVNRADGTKLSHEEVINQLNDQTVEYYTDFGIGGAFEELLHIQLKVEKHQYSNSVAWLRDLIWNSVFSKDRLEVTVAKLVQELPQRKRDGDTVSRAVSDSMLFEESKSTSAAAGLLQQLDFLPELASRIKDDPESVVKDLEEFRATITRPEYLRVAVAGNILQLEKPRSTWAENFRSISETKLAPVPWACDALSPLGRAPSKKCTVVALPSIEGSYSHHTAKGLTGWDHPDLPALEVAMSVLNALESYLWKYIRGSGLAYGCGTTASIEAGTVGFYVYKSPDASKAFLEAARVIKGLADESIALDDNIIEAAKSSLVFSYARREKSLAAATRSAFTNEVLKGTSLLIAQEMLEKIKAVSKPEILASLNKYFLQLFDASTSVVALATAPGKADEISTAFATFGFEVERKELSAAADDDGSDSDDADSSHMSCDSGEEESGTEDEGEESDSGSER